ncbi:MAG: pyrroline-5-carboxylate reductase, partial [Alphaproteobacteria bacterium]|nr:pyrroline-5-carboxylate reductase [Alphaproteobacteria bacterium]
AQMCVIDQRRPANLPAGVAFSDTLLDGAPDIMMLAFKPQNLSAFAHDIGARFGPATTLMSILAGVTAAQLRSIFPKAGAIIRAMPNLAAGIGLGVTALYAEAADATVRETGNRLTAPLGSVTWLQDEALFDAVTALSGCGPGFVFRFIDAVAQAGAALGLPAKQALQLALKTVEGAAVMASVSAEPPAVLADRVASPGGATRAGLDVLDDGAALARLMQATLAAAAKRSAELAQG